jgi:hypothetical protein
MASSGIFDTDIWLHLKTGKLILRDLRVPTFDPYSFTTGVKPWINHEWLFQVIVYSAYKFFDINGLICLQTLFITFAFFVLFLIGFKDKRFQISAFILSILIVYASRSRFNLRPDVLSLVFFAIFLHELKFAKVSKRIYFLLFWQVLWVNCHGYFFLGPLLILIFIISELLKRHCPYLPVQWSQLPRMEENDFKRLVRLFFLIFPVLLINPQFLNGALYPFHILKGLILGHAQFAFQHVEELAKAFYPKGNAFLGNSQFNILILITVISLLINWRKLDFTYILLFVFFTPFGFLALRNVCFLSFVCYFVIISQLELIERIAKKRVNAEVVLSKVHFPAKLIVIVIIILFIGNQSYEFLLRSYYDFDEYQLKSMLTDFIKYRYPQRCTDFILKNNLPKNLFNDFNSGSYLIFHAWPKYKVFVDGRTELYSNKFFDEYFKIMHDGDKEVFDSITERFNINTVLLNNATAHISKNALKMIYQHPGWQLVFFDEQGVVFLKKTPENFHLLKSLSVDLKKWKAPTVDILRLGLVKVAPDPYLSRARLLDILGLDAPLVSEVNEALKVSPANSLANFYLGEILFKQKNYKEALRYLRIAYVAGLDKSELRALLAKTYIKLGDKLRGMKFFKAVLKEDPKNTLANEFF